MRSVAMRYVGVSEIMALVWVNKGEGVMCKVGAKIFIAHDVPLSHSH